MFDAQQHLLRLARAKSLYTGDQDFLLRLVADELIDRLGAVKRSFDTGISLFARTPQLPNAMVESDQVRQVIRIEEEVFVPDDSGIITNIRTPHLLDMPTESADLVLAPLTLHWCNDLPGMLIQIRKVLKPDGLFMAVLPGPDTLRELREALLVAESQTTGGAAMRVDPFTEIRDAGALLQRAGFALPVVDQDTITVRYDTALGLVRDLRAFGATSHMDKKTKPPLYRSTVAQMMDTYADQFGDEDGRIRASFGLISMSGWVPHDSQQKPLRPGSAKSRLADALKTDEFKL